MVPSGVDGGRSGRGDGVGPMTMDEMKHQYRIVQEQIRRLEAERAAAIGRGDPTPRRVQFNLDMARIEVEELRMWGNRELTRAIQDSTR